jgi:hypothetical protein
MLFAYPPLHQVPADTPERPGVETIAIRTDGFDLRAPTASAPYAPRHRRSHALRGHIAVTL